MMPFQPEITVRALLPTDASSLRDVLNANLLTVPYSAPFTLEMVEEQILQEDPPTVYPVRWQQNRILDAWRAGQLVGFADIAGGQDSASELLADYEPIGLLRFLALPAEPTLVDEAGEKLLRAAEGAWRSAGIGRVKAFHLSTGYPSVQAGAGLLAGEMADQFRLLTGHDYQLIARYYALRRRLQNLVEEEAPMADLSLVHRGDSRDRRYEIYRRRAERVAEARIVRAALDTMTPPRRIAHLTHIWVTPDWRHHNLGRWLLRRVLNDATLQEYDEVIAYAPVELHIARTLLVQQGFEELNYRGYVLEKTFHD
ncbi:MAG: GNAT family N-acetyltransferase [Caldilineaceae bacterium]|nr:GNAT family N-acetyltransferase [Caldilineaceae bacterium]